MALFIEKNSIQETACSTLQDQKCFGFSAKSHTELKLNISHFSSLGKDSTFQMGNKTDERKREKKRKM